MQRDHKSYNQRPCGLRRKTTERYSQARDRNRKLERFRAQMRAQHALGLGPRITSPGGDRVSEAANARYDPAKKRRGTCTHPRDAGHRDGGQRSKPDLPRSDPNRVP